MAAKRSSTFRREEIIATLSHFFEELIETLKGYARIGHRHGLEDIVGLDELKRGKPVTLQEIAGLDAFRDSLLEEVDKRIAKHLATRASASNTTSSSATTSVSIAEHTHEISDLGDLTPIAKYVSHVFKPFIVIEEINPRATSAEVLFQLVSSGHYDLEGVRIELSLRENEEDDWALIDRFMFDKVTLHYATIVEDLKPSTTYEIRFTIKDRFNPLLEDAGVIRSFTTNVS